MMQTEIEDGEIIEDWLSARRKQRVHIRVPKKGNKGETGGACQGKRLDGSFQRQRTDQARRRAYDRGL